MKRDSSHLIAPGPARATASETDAPDSALDALVDPIIDLLYRAPRWLPSAHAQTIVPALFARRPMVQYKRERWTTPDGDFIDLDWLDSAVDTARPQAKAPL